MYRKELYRDSVLLYINVLVLLCMYYPLSLTDS